MTAEKDCFKLSRPFLSSQGTSPPSLSPKMVSEYKRMIVRPHCDRVRTSGLCVSIWVFAQLYWPALHCTKLTEYPGLLTNMLCFYCLVLLGSGEGTVMVAPFLKVLDPATASCSKVPILCSILALTLASCIPLILLVIGDWRAHGIPRYPHGEPGAWLSPLI